MSDKTVVVLGAGISGLTAAYVLSKKGFKTVVLEKSPVTGGLSATFRYKKHSLDYGPHNFHTGIPEVFRFVTEELKVPLEPIPVTTSSLYFMGKFIEYPITILNAIKNLNAWMAIGCFLDYLKTRLKARLCGAGAADDSFKTWVVNRFGNRLYNLYFGPYVEKIWGLSGEELDLVVAKKRIPEPSFFSLIVRALTRLKVGDRHSEDISRTKSYYPPKGIGIIADKLAGAIAARGGTIELGAGVSIVSTANKTIRYVKDGVERVLNWDHLVNTAPITDFVELLEDPGKGELLAMTKGLSYRSLILLYMFLSVEKVFNAPWVYFNECGNPGLTFNRAYEVASFSREMVEKGKGVLCLEITCHKGDATWKKADSELFDQCADYMAANGFLDRSSVDEYITKRLDIAYPVFAKGFRSRLTGIIDYFLDRKAGVYFIGRQGLYTYANIDHCIDMGLKLEAVFANDNCSREEFNAIYKSNIYF